MSCSNCGADVPYVGQITPKGIVHSCSKCHFVPKVEEEAEPDSAPTPRRLVKNEQLEARPKSSIVDQVRARLVALDLELERLDALKAERKQLAAMLKAAEKLQ